VFTLGGEAVLERLHAGAQDLILLLHELQLLLEVCQHLSHGARGDGSGFMVKFRMRVLYLILSSRFGVWNVGFVV
jgi:hypothetical protein